MFMMCGAFPGVYLYIPLLTQSSPSFLAHAGQGVPLQSAQTEIFSVHFDLFFKLRTAAFLGFRILLRTSRPFYTQKGRPQSSTSLYSPFSSLLLKPKRTTTIHGLRILLRTAQLQSKPCPPPRPPRFHNISPASREPPVDSVFLQRYSIGKRAHIFKRNGVYYV